MRNDSPKRLRGLAANPFESKNSKRPLPDKEKKEEKKKPQTFEELIHSRKLEELEKDALGFLENPVGAYVALITPDNNENDREKKKKKQMAGARVEWLRWIHSDKHLARVKWSYLVNGKCGINDRDEYVSQFFENCFRDDDFKEYLTKNWGSEIYYKNHFFYWFLNRYHIQYAIKVFSDSALLKWLPIWGNLLLIGLAWLAIFNFQGWSFLTWFCLILLTIFSGLLFSSRNGLDPSKLIHSMVPRLAGTTAIGYLFLLSVPQFIEYLCGQKIFSINHLAVGAGLLAAIFLFTCLQIQKRVWPELNPLKLFFRGLQLMIIAFSYSSLGLFLTKGFLFKKAVNGAFSDLNPAREELFLAAAISLAIGVILQLVWEEKPVTEPL